VIVATARGKYAVDEISKGRFRLTVIERTSEYGPKESPCRSGRYAYHRSADLRVGESVEVTSLVIRRGASLTFRMTDMQQDAESCCGFEDPIVSVEP